MSIRKIARMVRCGFVVMCLLMAFGGALKAQPLVTGDLSVYYSFDDFVDEVPDESGNAIQLNGDVYGELHQILQEEVIEEQNLAMVGLLRRIGIQKGQPLAAQVGLAWVLGVVYLPTLLGEVVVSRRKGVGVRGRTGERHHRDAEHGESLGEERSLQGRGHGQALHNGEFNSQRRTGNPWDRGRGG